MKKILIFGHKNPDTDSVCAAINLSYLKNKLGKMAEPRVLGELNDETKFALNYFNVQKPKYLNDVKVRIKDINYHKDFFINENKSILETYDFMHKNNISGIPLVDMEKKFKGYVSLKEIANTMIKDDMDYLNTTFDNIAKTLDSLNYLKIDDNIKGKVVVVSSNDEESIKDIKLDSETILIVSENKKIIDYAMHSKVKLIILIENRELNLEYILSAKLNKVNLICTSLSNFDVSRKLLLSNAIKNIKRNEQCISLNREDYLTDFIDISNKTKHTNYPILDNKNICYGLLRLIDIGDYEKQRVILVDHNETVQSVIGLDEAIILEIIDHHNIGNINTKTPINFRNMAVGSANTIIYQLYKENNVVIPHYIAGLMLSAILSDTVILNSPTTTELDKSVVKDLSEQLNIDYKEYGLKLLKSGMNYKGLEAEKIIYKDFKTYSNNEKRFSIAQVFSVDFDDFNYRLDEFVDKLEDINKNNNFVITLLFVTNILSKSSYIIYNKSSEEVLIQAYNLNNVYEGIEIEGILSRKKQIVPNIMAVLDKK